MGEGRTEPHSRRLTASQAAEQLGVSTEAIRGRIRRGTIRHERVGGRVYVLLPDERSTDQPPDRTELLIAELQDRVRSLEEANRENRRIIAALTSRIPQIEAPASSPGSEPSETPSEATEQPGRVGPQPAVESTQESREESGMHMPEAAVVVPCPMTTRGPQSAPGGVGCSEGRRLIMSGLREEVISIICEEWQKGQDRETEVNAAMISERLQKDGGSATEAQVKQELIHLADQGAITLALDRTDTPAIVRVNPDLCL